MSHIRIGNAPCSWGVLEFELEGEAAGCTQVLNEMAETGYVGTELGDWGFMPTDPDALAAELTKRGLTLLGAFVPVALKDPASHAPGVEAALKVARLLRATADRTTGYDATAWRPFLVLADNNGSDPVRTRNAGRVTAEMGLTDDEWQVFAAGAELVARAVYIETGLRTVFHHHCAGYVETPDEIARLLSLTDPAVLGLVFDTGHYAFAAGRLRGRGRRAEAFRRSHLVHPLQGLPSRGCRAVARRGVGLLRIGAPRRLLRAGQGLRGLPRGGRMAGRPPRSDLGHRGTGRAAGDGQAHGKRAAEPRVSAEHRT